MTSPSEAFRRAKGYSRSTVDPDARDEMEHARALRQLDNSTFADEGAFGRWCNGIARTLNYRGYHTQFSIKSVPGFPDWIWLKYPRLLVVELKMPNGKLSELHMTKGRHPRMVEGQKEWVRAFLRFWPKDATETAPAERVRLETYVWRPEDRRDIPAIFAEGPTEDMLCMQRMSKWLRGETDQP